MDTVKQYIKKAIAATVTATILAIMIFTVMEMQGMNNSPYEEVTVAMHTLNLVLSVVAVALIATVINLDVGKSFVENVRRGFVLFTLLFAGLYAIAIVQFSSECITPGPLHIPLESLRHLVLIVSLAFSAFIFWWFWRVTRRKDFLALPRDERKTLSVKLFVCCMALLFIPVLSILLLIPLAVMGVDIGGSLLESVAAGMWSMFYTGAMISASPLIAFELKNSLNRLFGGKCLHSVEEGVHVRYEE